MPVGGRALGHTGASRPITITFWPKRSFSRRVNRDERTDQVVRQLARLEDVIEVASESDGRAAGA
jgi:hypothetical protein